MISISRAALILTVLFAGACTNSPAAPASAGSISGTWEGRYEVLTCTTNAFDSRGCAHNRSGDVMLVLTYRDRVLIGSVQFRSDQTGALVVSTRTKGPLPITATFDPPQLSVVGSDAGQTPSGTYEALLHEWATVIGAGGEMNGTTAWTNLSTTTGQGTTTWRREYRLSGLRRAR
jgi:hypothetical protein